MTPKRFSPIQIHAGSKESRHAPQPRHRGDGRRRLRQNARASSGVICICWNKAIRCARSSPSLSPTKPRAKCGRASAQKFNAASANLRRTCGKTAFTELDAARISTIHSLCAEVLRAHPAEAGLDPNFVVLEEGQSAAWQAQAIEMALAWATTRSDIAPLIGLFTEGGLRHILARLIEKRLDVAAGWSTSLSTETLLTRWLDERLNAHKWREALDTLTEFRSRKADDKLEIARRAVLDRWRAVSAARAAADWNTLFDSLFQLRKATSTQGQKANWDAADLEATREAMATVRDYYEDEFAPLIGKEGSLNWMLDQQLADILPALQQLHHARFTGIRSVEG